MYNGREEVYLKSFIHKYPAILQNYPRIKIAQKNIGYYLFFLFIYHTRLFPDSILSTVTPDILKDISHTNSIHKIYLSSNSNIVKASPGGIIVMYRTNNGGIVLANYKFVVTSICTFEEVKKNYGFF